MKIFFSFNFSNADKYHAYVNINLYHHYTQRDEISRECSTNMRYEKCFYNYRFETSKNYFLLLRKIMHNWEDNIKIDRKRNKIRD